MIVNKFSQLRSLLNMSEADIGFGFKVVFVGNSGTGKTSAVERFCLGRFPDTPAKTLCSRFYERTFQLADSAESIELMIWDTPGRENLHLLAADSFQNANICVVFYSFTDRASFEAVPQWVEKVKAIAADAHVVIVENKVDLLDSGKVAFEDAERMAAQLDAPLFRVSVREGLNIKALFTYLAVTLQKKFLSSLNSLPLGADAFFVGNSEDRIEERSVSETARSATAQAQQGGRCEVA